GSVAVGHLPDDFAVIEVDGGDGSVWRFDERQALNVQARKAAATSGRGRAWRRAGGKRRIGAGGFTGPSGDADFAAGRAEDVVHVGDFLGRGNHPDRRDAGVAGVGVDHVGFGIV